MRGLLQRVFGSVVRGPGAFARAGMAFSELVLLHELITAEQCRHALEVGMANASSSIVICAALAPHRGTLVSIDPFQSTDYGGQGVANVRAAGFGEQHRLIEEPNYLALPELVRAGEKFDFIFVDGWHSFDHVMVDMFYSDHLLRDGGVLAFHDTDSPAVHKAVMFLERQRPYRRLSPPPMKALPWLPSRIARRLMTAAGARRRAEARERRLNWRTLAAYRKMRSELTPEVLTRGF